MRNAFLSMALAFSSMLVYAENHAFLLFSAKTSQENRDSLKKLCSFTFFPTLRMEEKDAPKIIDLIEQELNKVAVIVKKPLFSPEGIDLESFSHPSLHFTIEQLADQNDHPLSILQATLSVSSTVELSESKELASITTGRWSTYLEKTNNVQKAVQETLPFLLRQFIKDFYQANAPEQKPTFYIVYDSSLWASQVQE